MDNKYPKKMNVKTVKTKYGEILKIGIHKDVFKENDVEGDWLNIDVLRSKKDNAPYLVINEYKPAGKDENIVKFKDDEFMPEDEIPF
jgi:hypothetical protein